MELVQAAMMEELLNYFSEKTVWAAADCSKMTPKADATIVRMPRVLCNKGDEKNNGCPCSIGRLQNDQRQAISIVRMCTTPPQPGGKQQHV